MEIVNAVIKYLYIALIGIYIIINIIFLFKYSISYRIVDVDPNILKTRSMTFEEYSKMNKSYDVRKTINRVMLYTSVFICGFSLLLLYSKSFDNIVLLKVVISISFIWAILIFIAENTNMVPLPPIR